MTEYIPVHLVEYADHAELEVDYSGDSPSIVNHDDVDKRDVVQALKRSSVEEWGLESEIVTEDSPLWRDEFASLEAGDRVVLDGGAV